MAGEEKNIFENAIEETTVEETVVEETAEEVVGADDATVVNEKKNNEENFVDENEVSSNEGSVVNEEGKLPANERDSSNEENSNIDKDESINGKQPAKKDDKDDFDINQIENELNEINNEARSIEKMASMNRAVYNRTKLKPIKALLSRLVDFIKKLPKRIYEAVLTAVYGVRYALTSKIKEEESAKKENTPAEKDVDQKEEKDVKANEQEKVEEKTQDRPKNEKADPFKEYLDKTLYQLHSDIDVQRNIDNAYVFKGADDFTIPNNTITVSLNSEHEPKRFVINENTGCFEGKISDENKREALLVMAAFHKYNNPQQTEVIGNLANEAMRFMGSNEASYDGKINGATFTIQKSEEGCTIIANINDVAKEPIEVGNFSVSNENVSKEQFVDAISDIAKKSKNVYKNAYIEYLHRAAPQHFKTALENNLSQQLTDIDVQRREDGIFEITASSALKDDIALNVDFDPITGEIKGTTFDNMNSLIAATYCAYKVDVFEKDCTPNNEVVETVFVSKANELNSLEENSAKKIDFTLDCVNYSIYKNPDVPENFNVDISPIIPAEPQEVVTLSNLSIEKIKSDSFYKEIKESAFEILSSEVEVLKNNIESLEKMESVYDEEPSVSQSVLSDNIVTDMGESTEEQLLPDDEENIKLSPEDMEF